MTKRTPESKPNGQGNRRIMTTLRLRAAPLLTPLFRAWWRLRRPMTLGVRAIVCDAQERLLLVRHTYARGWHFPGGGVERGETALEALSRETAEEGGVAIEGDAELFGIYANHANFPNDHILIYRVSAWRPCAPKDDNEIAERKFFSLEALPEDTTKGSLRRIEEIFKGAPRSLNW